MGLSSGCHAADYIGRILTLEGNVKTTGTVLAGEQADGQREQRAVVGAGAEWVGRVQR